jgi:hypothetical protein
MGMQAHDDEEKSFKLHCFKARSLHCSNTPRRCRWLVKDTWLVCMEQASFAHQFQLLEKNENHGFFTMASASLVRPLSCRTSGPHDS